MSKRTEQAAFVCRHVFENSRPVLLVAHDRGDWMFLCGDEHQESEDDYELVGLNHILARDRTLEDVADLKNGYEAERSAPGQAWKRTTIENEV